MKELKAMIRCIEERPTKILIMTSGNRYRVAVTGMKACVLYRW